MSRRRGFAGCLDDRADESRGLLGEFVRGAGPVVFEPPDDGLHEHRGDDARCQRVGVTAGEVPAGHRGESRAHPAGEPGAPVAAEERAIEPVVGVDVTEEIGEAPPGERVPSSTAVISAIASSKICSTRSYLSR